jgi:NitT/TauT family transport system permease protein
MIVRAISWERAGPWVIGALSFTLFVVLWEAAGRSGLAFTTVAPPPSQFLAMVVDSGFRVGLGSQAASLDEAILSTFGRVFAGMGLAFVAQR